jgi:hypothetical protein
VFKDDRMMSMLTWTLVMLLIGTFIHRSDVVSDFFNGGAPEFALNRDEVTVPANVLTPIDVLKNDTGLRERAAESLQITRQPACGRVFVRWGVTHYLPADRCAGRQSFGYTVTGHGEVEGEVIATVVVDDPAQGGTGATPPTAPAPAPTPAPEPVAATPPQAPAPDPVAAQSAAPQSGATAGDAGVPADRSAPTDLAAAADGVAEQPPAPPAAALQQVLPDSNQATSTPAAPALAPQLPAPETGGTAGVQATAPDAPVAVAPAPVPAPEAPCTVPPSITVDVRPGALTIVSVEAPCDAGKVALLGYDTLEFGLALDGSGRGNVTVPGLQPSTEAELRLPSGDGLAFELPFVDTNRLDRVAIVWDAPVRLDLHAFEFGARPGTGGHVGPDQPRSFAAVRRHGGGYLIT